MLRRCLVAVLLVACSKQDAPVTDAGAPAVSASVGAGEPLTYRVSVVAMNGTVVEECTDLSVTVVPPPNARPGWKPKDDVVAGLVKVMKGAKRIDKRCEEELATRPALATCDTSATSKRTDGSEGQIQMLAHYYDYAKVGATDLYKSLCASRQGKWKRLASDADAWQKAKAEHEQQKDAAATP